MCVHIPSFKKNQHCTRVEMHVKLHIIKDGKQLFLHICKTQKNDNTRPAQHMLKGIKRWGPQPLLYDLIFKNTAKLWLFKE